MGKPIIHFEVAGTDGPALESFYKHLFDWKIDHQGEGDMQYGFISDGSAGPIGGGSVTNQRAKLRLFSTWK